MHLEARERADGRWRGGEPPLRAGERIHTETATNTAERAVGLLEQAGFAAPGCGPIRGTGSP
jgi:hypothetical protein